MKSHCLPTQHVWVWWLAGLISLARLQAADTNALLDAWFAAQVNFRGWSADFVQTRTLQVLTQPLVTTGRVWFAVPDRFRWELGQPSQTIALRQADEVLIVYPRLQRAERYALDSRQPGSARDALAMMEAGFPSRRADLEARFRLTEIAATNSQLHLTLQPKTARLRRLVGGVRLVFRTNDYSMETMEMTFGDGSRLRNDFAKAQVNPALPPDLFDPKLGPEIKIVQPMAR